MQYAVRSPVSVRSGPGTQFRWLMNLARGTRVDVTESRGEWAMLATGGWVMRDHLGAIDVVELPGMTVRGSVDSAADGLVDLGPPPFVLFRPRRSDPQAPPHAARTMMGGVHPRFEVDRAGHFTRAAMERHHIKMDRRAAARAMGRLHATLMFLAQRYNPHDFPRMEPDPGGGVRPRRPIAQWDEDGIAQFEEAKAARLVRMSGGEPGRWVSTLPTSPEFLDLEPYPDFREWFNEAVREQWSYLRDEQPFDTLLVMIVQEIAMRGAGRAAGVVAGRSGRSAADIARAGAASVHGVSRLVLGHVRLLLGRMRTRALDVAEAVRRILGPRARRVPVNFYPTNGRTGTLPGVGAPVGGGTLRGMPPPSGGGTLREFPPPPAGRGGSAPAGTPPTRSGGGGSATSGAPQPGYRTEPVTAEQAENLHEFAFQQSLARPEAGYRAGEGVLMINETWGSSPSMLESYTAKWIQYAGRSRVHELPPHGFKVFNPDGTIREICLHLTRHPGGS